MAAGTSFIIGWSVFFYLPFTGSFQMRIQIDVQEFDGFSILLKHSDSGIILMNTSIIPKRHPERSSNKDTVNSIMSDDENSLTFMYISDFRLRKPSFCLDLFSCFSDLPCLSSSKIVQLFLPCVRIFFNKLLFCFSFPEAKILFDNPLVHCNRQLVLCCNDSGYFIGSR
jgi:hypothetical protein